MITLLRITKENKYIKSILFIAIIVIISLSLIQSSYSKPSDSERLYLAPVQDTQSLLFKIIFYPPASYHGTVIARNEKRGVSLNTMNEVHLDSANKVVKLYETSSGEYKLILEIIDGDSKIKIEVYNLLAYKVLDVYEGKPKEQKEFFIKTNTLINGIYLCLVTGRNFRLIRKFIVSR